MEDKDTVGEATELVGLMTDAQLDKFVDFIRDELRDRARRRNRMAKAQLNIGDKVKIAGKTKPQYLQGMTGEIIEIRQSRVLMKFDRGPVKKFRSGNVLINPAILEKI